MGKRFGAHASNQYCDFSYVFFLSDDQRHITSHLDDLRVSALRTLTINVHGSQRLSEQEHDIHFLVLNAVELASDFQTHP